jgi:hypothetical protein
LTAYVFYNVSAFGFVARTAVFGYAGCEAVFYSIIWFYPGVLTGAFFFGGILDLIFNYLNDFYRYLFKLTNLLRLELNRLMN